MSFQSAVVVLGAIKAVLSLAGRPRRCEGAECGGIAQPWTSFARSCSKVRPRQTKNAHNDAASNF